MRDHSQLRIGLVAADWPIMENVSELNDKPMVRLANPRRVTLANVRTHAELHELAAHAKAEAQTPAGPEREPGGS